MGPVESIHHQLVGAGDAREAVRVVELLGDVLAEAVAGAARRDAPAATVIRVGPKQIAHRALLGHLLNAVELSNLVERVDRGRETAVETEDLVLDHRGERQVIEQLSEHFPDIGISVFAEALVVEAVPID